MGSNQMPYKGEQPTLLGFICSPFVAKITREPLSGRPYVRSIDLVEVDAQLYSIGAALGRALRNKLDTLVKLLFVPDTEDSKVNRVMRLCKEDATKNLEEFKNKFGQEPDTFDDLTLYRSIEKRLGAKGTRLSAKDAIEVYIHGDRKIKKLFHEKVDLEGVGESTTIMLLQGIQFGSSFPELTEKMYQKAYKDSINSWTGTWAHGSAIPEGLRVMSLEETERAVLQIVAVYASKYYPKLVEPLGLGGIS